MIIDTHAHLNFSAYNKDLDEVIKRALVQDIWMINVGSKYDTSKKAVEIAEKHKQGVYAAVGLHPIYSATEFVKVKTDHEEGSFNVKEESFDKEKYMKLAESEKVVAIGEIGLDYYYKPKTKAKLEQFKQKQKQVFIKQLEMAEELNLPVILHCRMAHQDLLEILNLKLKTKNAKLQLKTQNYNIKGVIHCFTGNWEQAKQYLDLGFHLGINGIIYKMDLEEVIKKTPLEKILIETDCPYLTPPKAESFRNEPVFIKYIIDKIAQIRNIDSKEVSMATFSNARELFKI